MKYYELTRRLAEAAGSQKTFGLSLILIVIWFLSGPLFRFSDTWQLIINTTTTVVTFLMVFIIQNTQNRDSKAIHIKLDELIRAVDEARNELINIENEPSERLDRIKKNYE